MIFSLTSFISSSAAITLLIGFLFLVIKKEQILSHFGLGCIYFLIFLILLRGFLPFDFYGIRLTTSIYSHHILPKINDLMKSSLCSIGTVNITPYKILFLLWFTGFCIALVRIVYAYHKAKKYLDSLPCISEESTYTIFQEVSSSVLPEKSTDFKLVCSDIFSSPAIFGLKKIYVILPPIDYSANELHLIFKHELLHYRKKDFLCKMILDALVCIHWWNPLVSIYLFPAVNHIQELSVDYHLTKTLKKEQKELYLDTILKTLKYQKTRNTSINKHKTLYALVDNHCKPNIAQRFNYLTKQHVRYFSISGILLCIILFIGSFTIVFEPYYEQTHSEYGNPIYHNIKGETFYIKNGDSYDLYMENEYVCTTSEPFDEFKNAPVYNSLMEVPHNE